MKRELTPAEIAEADRRIEYREVEGFPLYRVGQDGSIWSKAPCRDGMRSRVTEGEWRKLVGWKDRHGYAVVMLSSPEKNVYVFAHKLVLEAFVGKKPEGKQCAHANGVRHDNRLVNLRWATQVENAADKKLHGTELSGDRHYSRTHPEKLSRGHGHWSKTHPEGLERGEARSQSVLTDELVRKIRALRREHGIGAAKIARLLGIKSKSTVHNVLVGQNWRHVI